MREEPGEGTGSDQIRLARVLKFKEESARDGKGLFSPFLGVACREQGLGTPSRTQIQRRMDCGGIQPWESVQSDGRADVISKVLPFGCRHNHWNFLKHGKLQVARYGRKLLGLVSSALRPEAADS